jgi:hypothetical protein
MKMRCIEDEKMPIVIEENMWEENNPVKQSELIELVTILKDIVATYGIIKGVCPICRKSGKYLLLHHVSYFPERTIFVCQSCHVGIHAEKSIFPELSPPKGDSDKYYRKDVITDGGATKE